MRNMVGRFFTAAQDNKIATQLQSFFIINGNPGEQIA